MKIRSLDELLADAFQINFIVALEALRSGVAKPEDLDPENNTHVKVVVEYGKSNRISKAKAFLKKMSLMELDELTSGPMRREAESEIARWLKIDEKGVLNYYMSWSSCKKEACLKWPLVIQKATKTLLSDPAKTPDFEWEKVRCFLEESLAREIGKARGEAKRKRRKASRQVQNDPLLQAILKEDTSRMERFKLEQLSPVRWEKVKEAWLKSSPSIKRWMMRLPWKIVEPYALEVLNLVGEGPPYVPAWPIPKETLKKLSPNAAFIWLNRLFHFRNTHFRVEPKLTWREIQEDLRPLLIAAALENEKVQNMVEWLDLLHEFRATLRLGKEMGGKLSDQEIAKVKCIFLAEGRWFYVWSGLYENLKAIPHVPEFIKWVASLPIADRARFGNYLRGDDVKWRWARIFGDDLMEQVFDD
jgi:hypothetical protein